MVAGHQPACLAGADVLGIWTGGDHVRLPWMDVALAGPPLPHRFPPPGRLAALHQHTRLRTSLLHLLHQVQQWTDLLYGARQEERRNNRGRAATKAR